MKKITIIWLSSFFISLSILPIINLLEANKNIRQDKYYSSDGILNRWIKKNYNADFLTAHANWFLLRTNLNYSKDVVFGDNNFLFLKWLPENNLISKNNSIKYANKNVIKKKISSLQTLHIYLENKKIPFLVVIAPNKMSIYPENIKSKIPLNVENATTKLVIEQLAQKNIPTLYLKEELLKQKEVSHNPLYYYSDTHWNMLGGFIGYRKIMNMVNETYRLNYDMFHDINLTNIHSDSGDLLKKLHLPIQKNLDTDYIQGFKGRNTLTSLINYDIDLTFISEEKISNPFTLASNIKKIIHPASLNEGTLFYIRDSFGGANGQLFQATFSETWHIPNENIFDKGFVAHIDNIKPNLVIYEIIERNLDL